MGNHQKQIACQGALENAVQAIKLDAYDCLTQPGTTQKGVSYRAVINFF